MKRVGASSAKATVVMVSDKEHHWLLNGGIGSGKTTVRQLFEEFGVQTVDSDSIGHDVIEPEGPAFAEVASTWPEVLTGGVIDRPALGRVVFSDQALLRKLERITHPHILRTIELIAREALGLLVVEIPLISTSLSSSWRRMVVDASPSVRLERLVSRGMDSADAVQRMAAQPSGSDWLAIADVVVPNDQDVGELTSTFETLIRSRVFSDFQS